MIDIINYLKNYDARPLRIMEICGTHTAEISKNGIVSLLSENIELVSGPGCPVCVTVTDYIDRLVELSMIEGNTVVSFGDLLRVKGSKKSLDDARAEGGSVRMVYSPMDILNLAKENKSDTFIFAAVGFETTAPVYAILLDKLNSDNIGNVKLLTSLKTMPAVVDWVCKEQGAIDGFIAPGHVGVITGSNCFSELSKKYQIPFVVAGFDAEQLIAAIYALVIKQGKGEVINLYRSAVTDCGNEKAKKLVEKYFTPCDAAWRGIGPIKDSGIILRSEYADFDAGSKGLDKDNSHNSSCRCAQVLTGSILPSDCPLFGTVCSPVSPQGACMVSTEGSCYNWFIGRRSSAKQA